MMASFQVGICLVGAALLASACGLPAASEDVVATQVSATLTALAATQPEPETEPTPEPEQPAAEESTGEETGGESPSIVTNTPTPTQIEQVAYSDVLPDGNPTPGNEVFDESGTVVGIILGGLQIAEIQGTQDDLPLVQGRLAIRVEAWLSPDGTSGQNGDGIENVAFTITRAEDGLEVHQRTDENAPYCWFGDEEDCTVWDFAENDNAWPDGTTLEAGAYQVSATITLKDSFAQAFWFTQLYLEP